MAGQSDHGMVAGHHRVADQNALDPLDTAADPAKEYIVGQGETAGLAVFVLPLQAGSGCHNIRWHLGLTPSCSVFCVSFPNGQAGLTGPAPFPEGAAGIGEPAVLPAESVCRRSLHHWIPVEISAGKVLYS